jgi:hypothetical protein
MTDTLEPLYQENEDDLSWVDDLLEELLNGEDSEEETDEDLIQSQEGLVAEMVAQGSTQEDAERWVKEFSDYTADELEHLREDQEELLALLDGPFKILRDDTFPDPDRLLVWDKQATPVVQALTFAEATERYQCGGAGSRWIPADLQAVKEAKAQCLEETMSSYKERDADPDYDGLCYTPSLVVSNNPLRPHRWNVVKAYMDPIEEDKEFTGGHPR